MADSCDIERLSTTTNPVTKHIQVRASSSKHENYETSDGGLSSFTGGSEEDETKVGGCIERPLRRKRRVKGQKICGVCGDLAQSYNFDVLTCETCKAFFRRNACKMKELQTCSFSGNCIITKATRRFCASCRLKKCFAIGMNPELILDVEERKERQKNRNKASAHKKAQDTTSSTTSAAKATTPKDLSLNQQICNSSDVQVQECTREEATSSRVCNMKTEEEEGTGNTRLKPDPDSSKCQLWAARGIRFQHVDNDKLPKSVNLYWSLSSQESYLLEHLTSCYKEIFWVNSSVDVKAPVSLSDLPVEKVMLAIDLLLRKFITFSKRVPEFRQLVEADQMTLLKTTAMRLYCVRLAESYVAERRSWRTQVGEVSELEVTHLFKKPEILQAIISFSQGSKFVIQDNVTLCAIMHTLVLFDPRDSSLQDAMAVNSYKDRYMMLLKHHLDAKYSFLYADRYLAEIVQIILDLNDLGVMLMNFFTDYSSHFYPLISEFLNQ